LSDLLFDNTWWLYLCTYINHMKITKIVLNNVRGFIGEHIINTSSSINVFIGANNSGKSTILNAVYSLQKQTLIRDDISIGKNNGKILLEYIGRHEPLDSSIRPFIHINLLAKQDGSYLINTNYDQQISVNFSRLTPVEPFNLIYPYLSKRKVNDFSLQINEQQTTRVSGSLSNLYAKIDRVITPQFQPANSYYLNACKEVLGYEISAYAKGEGKEAVYFISNQERIPISRMGEGVVNIIGLIVDLCIAENKIFLIEELENDIHPKALKALLKLIIEKSTTNQFFISTHSNIVMKYLGGVVGAKLFNIISERTDEERPNLFVSRVEEVLENSEDRRQILEDLGYDFFDMDLWQGWLFLEESSAETLIRDYFIKWYVPSLKGKLRTFSASGKDSISMKFEDFNRLFVFLHLEPTYKNRVWVLIDGGEEERAIIDKMKTDYARSGWTDDKFQQLTEHDFEKYFPDNFKKKVEEILAIQDKKKKREAKKGMLNELIVWINEDEARAKDAFANSAKEVIDYLIGVGKQLKKGNSL
jgi:AAA15 family ATPase/GTPase